MKKSRVLVSVAWPYVNGDLHIGHLAGNLLPADIYARFRRSNGDDVWMVSGSDCHGTPITVEAEKRQISPEEVVALYHPQVKKLFLETLGLTYDIYTTTMTKQHEEVVQTCFLRLLQEGYIVKQTSAQYYSPDENRFLPDRYVEGTCSYCGFKEARGDQCDNCGKLLDTQTLVHPHSKMHKSPVEVRDTEHYFIDWPKLQDRLRSYVDVASPAWRTWVAQETKGWLDEGLQPRAITRDIDWGVAVPHDHIPDDMKLKDADSKRFYVWFEAVLGYLSASQELAAENNTDWKDFWMGDGVEHHYFMGKDNLVFHTLFLPGQLMVMDPDLHLPDVVTVNMFLNLEGKQFSKSRGVSITIQDIVERYGNDPVRFYLTSIMPETSDASFSWKGFEEVHNNVLVATYGNYVSRTIALGKGVDMQAVTGAKMSQEGKDAVKTAFEGARKALLGHTYKEYVKVCLDLAAHANKFISEKKVWELRNKESDTQSDEYYAALHEMFIFLLSLAVLFEPLMPTTSHKIFDYLGFMYDGWPAEGEEYAHLSAKLGSLHIEGEFEHLFTKITTDA